MRAGHQGSFIFQKKHNKLIGINLGSDSVAEHERPINGIKRELGIDENAGFGLIKRQVTNVPPILTWFETTFSKKEHAKQYVGFALYPFYNGVENWVPREMYSHSDEDKSFYSGWDDKGLYVLTEASNKTATESLKEIFDALKAKNACVWLGGGGVFNNAGLCIGIVDKMPKEIFQQWHDTDCNSYKLTEEFNATGIEKLLNDAGKQWFCLVPKRNSEGKMIIWLNPYDQHNHNAGRFTVEQLKLWAKDKGPVMMTDKQKRERER